MADANGTLRAVLVERYDLLVGQIERRLQSSELARDALHDTYLRLERGKELPEIMHPVGYLVRIAVNLARDRQRQQKRLASFAEIETALNLVDDSPDPSMAAESRSDFEAFERALAELPARRRAILLASFSENLPSRTIARRFGLSKRMIDIELKLAREHCARVMMNLPRK